MKTYSWDAGVAIGFFLWEGAGNKQITDKIDALASNCYRFSSYASSCKNFMPANASHEVESRLGKINSTILALIDYFSRGKITIRPGIDFDRFNQYRDKLKHIDPKEAVRVLTMISSSIFSKKNQLNALCNIQKYHKRLDKKIESTFKHLFKKDGDHLNFSATIHIHNYESPCSFITTDKADFQNIGDINIAMKIPQIEFVQDY